MGYTVDAATSDCYPGTTVLINRLNLQVQDELNAVEAALVTAKAMQWEENPQCDTFDFEHYKIIHKHLFGELYDWAGEIRTINISKKGTQFCPVEEIPRVTTAIFAQLERENFFRGLSRGEFITELADFYQRTNELHPFREGNGRTQRLFLIQLAQSAGYRLDFSGADPDELMIATIYSAQGVEEPLLKLFDLLIKENDAG